MDENFPLTWHLKAETAGGGPLFDLASHNLDLARFLVGEIESVYASARLLLKKGASGRWSSNIYCRQR